MAQIPGGQTGQQGVDRYVPSKSSGKYIEHGQQPAKIQYRPVARPSNSSPLPPPPPATRVK